MATTPTPSFVSPLCFGSIEEELILPYRVAVELLAVADQVAGAFPEDGHTWPTSSGEPPHRFC